MDQNGTFYQGNYQLQFQWILNILKKCYIISELYMDHLLTKENVDLFSNLQIPWQPSLYTHQHQLFLFRDLSILLGWTPCYPKSTTGLMLHQICTSLPLPMNCDSISIQMDSDDELLVLPSPISSTPKPTVRSSTTSVETQTLTVPTIYIQCDAECQTDFSVTMDTAEADLSPTTNPKSYHQPPTPESRPVPAPRHQPPTPKSRPVPAPRTSLSTKTRPTPAPRTSLCTQPTPAHIPVPTIPCSNRFELLQTEHCNDTPTCGKIKQVPQPSTDLIVNMDEPPIPKPEPTATHHPRTVLMIGDSRA